MSLENLSTEDLEALANNNLEALSDEGLSIVANLNKSPTPTNTVLKGAQADRPSTGLQRATAVTQGLSFGLSDELQGIIEGVSNIPSQGLEGFSDAYTEGRDAQRDIFQTAQDERPLETLGLAVAGGVGTSAGTGVGNTIASRFKKSSAEGALAGFGFSEGNSIDDLFKDVISGGALGGILGLVGEGVGKLAFSTKNMFSPTNKKVASELAPNPDDMTNVSEKIIRIQNSLQRAKTESSKAIDNLFDDAGKSGKDAWFVQRTDEVIADRLLKTSEDTIGETSRNMYLETAQVLRNKVNENGTFSVRDAVDITKQLQNKMRSSDPDIVSSARQIKEIFDEELEKALTSNRVVGDQRAVGKYKKALTAWQKEKDTFSPTKKNANGNYVLTPQGKAIFEAIDLDAKPEEVAALMFGNGKMVNNRAGANTFDAVLRAVDPVDKDIVARDMKSAMLSKLFKDARSKTADEEVMIRTLANDLKDFRKSNTSLFNKFSESERTALKGLEDSLREVGDGGVVSKIFENLQIFFARSGVRVQTPQILRAPTGMQERDAARFLTTPIRTRSGNIASAASTAGTVSTLAQPRKEN